MMPWIVIASFVAGVDRLYWAIFKIRDMRIPPKGDPWLQAVFSAVGGALGAFAITRITGQSEPFTTVVGGVIGGRIVGGIIETFASGPQK